MTQPAHPAGSAVGLAPRLAHAFGDPHRKTHLATGMAIRACQA
jgi:hypothetical protein